MNNEDTCKTLQTYTKHIDLDLKLSQSHYFVFDPYLFTIVFQSFSIIVFNRTLSIKVHFNQTEFNYIVVF